MKKRFSLSAILSICFGCAIIVLMFAACSKKSERTEGSTQSQTATAEQTQTVVMQTANPHPEILNGDLSAFAGIWVNGEGIKQEVRADGTVYKEGSNDARAASGFQRLDNDSYYWLVSILNYEGMGRGAFNAQLYPVGVEVIGGNGKISTDTSKVRMFYPEVDAAYRSEEIYYRADEASTLQSNSKESQFVYTVQFNNQTIPITVFYSVTGADREGMDLDRMVFMYGNTEQT
ncbi:MAG: hypothetical protein LBH16_02915, partial [Treponema sp.]|nr:hypothetical protein [Treponema sp.]